MQNRIKQRAYKYGKDLAYVLIGFSIFFALNRYFVILAETCLNELDLISSVITDEQIQRTKSFRTSRSGKQIYIGHYSDAFTQMKKEEVGTSMLQIILMALLSPVMLILSYMLQQKAGRFTIHRNWCILLVFVICTISVCTYEFSRFAADGDGIRLMVSLLPTMFIMGMFSIHLAMQSKDKIDPVFITFDNNQVNLVA